ncbi:MAG: helix-turn-helix domain-containing protein [Pseudotabrizicola sp.]|uniref:helix-turn-helix transcriptional regulator n=1 Tax=Pseudotabrizicola sp. TaxID=2939647 RepID=UPI00271CA03E|nr:helix-turn-helix transcriptional regulator [Pseudotabrizicola sp.]MDO8881602.1 helix-turn-helix domain-containing protein [Pseudotabrizicola sp.]MDP2081546.1 helix-turn-helix domain-containing protein [Pseudotabrizicola sp.]MDZ7575749.1 helix-turn-helix domain-containing protein [Pseudotabrizicola sp.]
MSNSPSSAPASLTGSLIRERRLALGLRQGEVAQSAGVSASYLNLIEHNRRRVGAEVLERLAAALGTEVAILSEGAGGALIDDLRAAASTVPGVQPELDRIEDFAGRFPGWAAVLAAQHHRAAQLERAVGALNDRLTHDPHLSASLHEVLSALASVRSTAAILADTEDIDPDWRARFHQNLHQDSERLAHGAEALVAYLDGPDTAVDAGLAAPQEEVEGWLAARGWHLAELAEPGGFERLMAEVAGLAAVAARSLAQEFLRQSADEARLLPDAVLRAALEGGEADPSVLAQRSGLPVLAVMRRIALLPGSVAGLVICDASGTLLFRKPVDGFALPRFGAACPLWPLFAALARPMMPMVARVEPAGRAARVFRTLSICETRLPQGFSGPDLREAAMLILPDDAPLRAAGPVLALGSSCRICPRAACPARREPSILTEAGVQ